MSKNLSRHKHVVAGLDIGTTKVTCVIASGEGPSLEIIGVGKAVNLGMRHGAVVNIEIVTEAITKAREEAELMAGVEANSVWLAVGGMHISSFDSSGMIAIRNKEVGKEDIERVIEAARAVAIPQDRQVLHILPNDYRVDQQEGILDPIGMAGVRLESSVHIISGSAAALQNAVKCTEKAGLKVEGLVLQQLASALSVLSDDEKNLGVCVVDMGGGTCDLVTFSQGSVVHTASIPVGGNNFTHDVAMGLRTSQVDAELLKKKFGHALPETVTDGETVEAQGVGGRQARTLARLDLCEILEARAEETLRLIRWEIEKSGFMGRLGSGVVLTGGASQLPGLAEMGDFVFEIPVRRGCATRVGGLTDVVKDASFATSVGLVLFGWDKLRLSTNSTTTMNLNKESIGGKLEGWARRFKELLGAI